MYVESLVESLELRSSPVRGRLSCERCGSIEVRRHPKKSWDVTDRWMCRSCIIVFELVAHVRGRMRFEQHRAKHYSHLQRTSSRDNVKDNLASARARASKLRLPATLMMAEWRCLSFFFQNACAYCGDTWDEIEHATPFCHGGGTTIANCVPACKACNGKKRQRTLEELLAKDLWPHRTERLKRALAWLQLHGRTATEPSGRSSQLSLEVQALIKLRERESVAVKPCWGPHVWFGLDAEIVAALSGRGLVQASALDQSRVRTPYKMQGPCWEIHLTETGRGIEILDLPNVSADAAITQQRKAT